MTQIAKFFLDNHKLTIVITFGLLLFGVMGLKRMNAESFPNVNMGVATIITSYDGATAEDMEIKITRPIEEEIRGVSGIKDIKSVSQAGLSTIVVRVDIDDPSLDMTKVMAEIQRAVDRTPELPADLKDPPTFVEMNSEEFPVIEIAVSGANINRERDLTIDLLKEELEDNKRVKNIRLVGYSERAFQIKIDLIKMKDKFISMDEVLDKIRLRNVNTPGGTIKTDTIQNLVRVEGKVSSKKDLENVVLRSNFSGKTIFLKDIADVSDSEEELQKNVSYNGEDAALLIVTKKGGADTIALVKDVLKKLDEFKIRHPAYHYEIYNNEALKVKNRVEILSSNALSGLVLVVVFLFLFLPGKIGLAASMSLPVCVLATTGLMPVIGTNINTITILALVIALGMLVDNSVVISENFTRLRQEGMGVTDAALVSVQSLWLPITGTALTTIAAFLPMLVTKGVMGQFIRWIPIIVSLSLVLSLVESFFLLPIRLKYAGKVVKPIEVGKHKDWFAKFELKFEHLVEKLVNHRYWVGFIFTVIIFISFFMMVKANKFVLFPAEQTEMYVARVEMTNGTRLEVTADYISKLENAIREKLGKDVLHIVGRAGVSTMGPGDPKAQEGNNVGMVSIYVSDNFKFNVSHTEVLAKLREIKIPEITSMAFEAKINGPPVGNAIEATFRSNDKVELQGMVDSIKNRLKEEKGIFNLRIDDVIGDDEIYIHVDYEKADRLGLNVKNVGTTVRAAVSGNRVSKVTLNNKDIDLIVRFKDNYRKNIDDLKQISVVDRSGNLVPIGTFSTFETLKGRPQIKRFDFKRSKTLLGETDDIQMTSFGANKILNEVYEKNRNQYPGVSLVFGGAQENTKESMESLYQALVLSLIGIFALLVFLFKSYLRPFIIMTTIPLGLFGFSLAFYFHGRPISFLALIGIIGLGGIIVNSGIVLISFIDSLKEEGKLTSSEIMVKASGLRLRAVMVTSLTTISGLLPTAYGIGGSDAVLIPMTLAMAWGLTSGTILTLIWIPCAYMILEDTTEKLKEYGVKILSLKLFNKKVIS